jgi:hypothetical protein
MHTNTHTHTHTHTVTYTYTQTVRKVNKNSATKKRIQSIRKIDRKENNKNA